MHNLGSKMLEILSVEECCIFLEEDNEPSIEFFNYCKLMLQEYYLNEQVLWVCGTNYLDDFDGDYQYDISFTQHHFPCGFATWSNKFKKYYKIRGADINKGKSRFINSFSNKILAYQEWISQKKTEYLIENYESKTSWDRQMQFSIRSNGLVGIIPKKNYIKNIGVDDRSTHGGVSLDIVMTNKFCTTPRHDEFKVTRLPPLMEINIALEKKYESFFIKPIKSNIKILLGLVFKAIRKQNIYKPNFLDKN
jgi:hypothetical protein